MTAVNADLVSVVERSPAATDIGDRAAWVGLFTPDGRVEDPYGSRPHVGHEQIGRFYDTFIGPRQIIFHRDLDAVVDTTVVRDLMLEIVMAPDVSLDVPMHIRYDLREVDGGDWAVERLCAHWELPIMVVQMLRHGGKALPPSLRLAANLLRNQGLAGTAGFAAGFGRPGKRDKRCVRTFLDAAVAGDDMGARRAAGHGAAVRLGEDSPIAMGELVGMLRGGRWSKLIAAGDTVSASVTSPTGRGVVFCETNGTAGGLSRIRFFGSG
jgi:hypothetical protein